MFDRTGRRLAYIFVFMLMSMSFWLDVKLVDANGREDTIQEIIAVYKNEVGKAAIHNKAVNVRHEFQMVPAISATVTTGVLQELLDNPNVAYIEPNIHFELDSGGYEVITVPDELSQWNFKAVQPTKMWDQGFTGAGIKVAVIDTGIAVHPELKIAGGVSTVDYTTSYQDDNGHGTHVAGIIAAQKNDAGMVGIAPGVELYAVKAMDQEGGGDLQDLIEAIEWSIDNEMDIINISLSTGTGSKVLKEIIDRAYDEGIIIVSAAGNSQKDQDNRLVPLSTHTIQYPAKYDSAIAVAAIDRANRRADFSSVGEEVELTAPGVDIISTYKWSDGQAGYARTSGTSQAAPHISGMIALLMQKHPEMSNIQIRKEIQKYAVDLGQQGHDIEYGLGFPTFSKDITPPADVTNLTIASNTSNSLTLSWSNPDDADFKTNHIYVNYEQVGSTSNHTFALEALEPDKLYIITVKSVDRSGNESAGVTLVETTNTGTGAIQLASLIHDPVFEYVIASMGQAAESNNPVPFVKARLMVKSVNDQQIREQLLDILTDLKKKLQIVELPSKNMLSTASVSVNLQLAMNSAQYKFIDEASLITTGERKNVFIFDSEGNHVDDAEVYVLYNSLVVKPQEGQTFAPNETYTLIIDTTVKGKKSRESEETFKLKNPLILEFTTHTATAKTTK